MVVNDKYKQDVERCEEIHLLLESRYRQYSERIAVTRYQVAKPFSRLTGLSYSSAVQYLNRCPLAQQISSESSRRLVAVHLERLAILYALIGIEENDRIVQLTREVINPVFQYPPRINSSDTGQNLEARL